MFLKRVSVLKCLKTYVEVATGLNILFLFAGLLEMLLENIFLIIYFKKNAILPVIFMNNLLPVICLV